MFRTLELSTEGRKRRSAAFVSGLFAEILVLAGAALLGILFPEKLPLGDKHYALAWLPTLTPPGKPPVKPPREVPRVVVPRLKTPDPLVLPVPAVAKLEVPKIQPPRVPTPAPPMLTAPPPPKQAPKEEVAVHTGLFGGAPEPVTTKRPKEQVQTGGFGSPQGFPGKAQGDNPGNVPKLGAFGLPEGPGVGNGTGGSRGVRGVVASAGFGSGVAGSGYGHGGGGNGTVATGGFEKARQVAQPRVETAQAPPPAEIQPVEILSKPSPVYTEVLLKEGAGALVFVGRGEAEAKERGLMGKSLRQRHVKALVDGVEAVAGGIGPLAMILRARTSARGSNSAKAATSLTRPMRRASSALIISPVRMICRARPLPTGAVDAATRHNRG